MDKEKEVVTIRHSRVTDMQTVSLTELLLDERLSHGEILPPASYAGKVGGENRRLSALKRYEWLLRLAEVYPVELCPAKEPVSDQDEATGGAEKAAFLTDAYVAARYADQLRAEGLFDTVLAALIEEAGEDLTVLEEMIGKKEAFWNLYDATAPVLLYYGPTWCYNALNIFIEELKKALVGIGIPVMTYDEQKEDVSGLSRFAGRRFQAVIDVQSYLFSVFLKDTGGFLHDRIIGPKFNVILDHPLWLKQHLSNSPANTTVLTHDRHYCTFVEQYYPSVERACLFPPAGIRRWDREEVLSAERPFDLVFIGTYGNYRKKIEEIRSSAPKVRRIAMTYLKHLKNRPDLTAEAAFENTLKELGIRAEGSSFLELMFDFRSVVQLVMFYYREKTVRSLLDAKITVSVFGDTWKDSPLKDHPFLRLHGDVTNEESLQILKTAKISLNVMAWHKGGFTERMANSMLCGAVVLSDETDFEGLADGKQLRMFPLGRKLDAPRIASELLSDAGQRKRIRETAYDYAEQDHTWRVRAEQFVELIDHKTRGESCPPESM